MEEWGQGSPQQPASPPGMQCSCLPLGSTLPAELGRRMGLRGPGACSWELKISAWGREKGTNQKHSTEKRFPIKSLLCGEKIYIFPIEARL